MPHLIASELWFNHSSGRYMLGTWDLHCGNTFQVELDGKWIDTRIEHGRDGWYLVGIPEYSGNLRGLSARPYPR